MAEAANKDKEKVGRILWLLQKHINVIYESKLK